MYIVDSVIESTFNHFW